MSSAKKKSVRDKPAMARALAESCPDLMKFPKGQPACLLKKPYRGVLRGLCVEGSPQGYLWRIRLFAFLPVKATEHLILANTGNLDNLWWNSQEGYLEIGGPWRGFGAKGDDFLESVRGVYELEYRPWLDARATPEKLLEITVRPRSDDVYIPPRWWLSSVNAAIDYSLICLKCGRLNEAQDLIAEILEYVEKAPADENLERIKKHGLPQLNEIKGILEMSAIERERWTINREGKTFQGLHLNKDLIQ